MFWDGLFCFYWLARRTLFVFLGREGSSICITKRFEQQVLFWMFTFFCVFVYIFCFCFLISLQNFQGTRKKVNALWVSSLHLCFTILRVVYDMLKYIFWLYLKWSPISFGPLTFSAPKKFGPFMRIILRHFYAGKKLPGAKSSRGPKKSGSQMWLGTISVIAYFLSRAKSEHFCSSTLNSVHSKCKFNKASFNVFLTSNYSPNSNE